MKRYYYLKKIIPSYTIWALLSGLFSFFFILAKANFESLEIKQLFLLSWLVALLIASIATLFNFGGFKLLFGINIGHRYAFVINSFIIDNHVDSNISDENLEELFYVLKRSDYFSVLNGFTYTGLVVIINTLIMFFVGTSPYNLIIILLGGFLGIILFCLLATFSTGIYLSSLLRENERMIEERGIKPEKVKQFISLKNSFYYFLLLFTIIIIVVLSFVPFNNLYLLGLVFAGLIMVLVVARFLFSSILSVFEEISDFAHKLPKEKEIKYFTGSYYSEVSGLAKDLNESASKIYEAREVEKSARIKLEELDKVKDEFITTAAHQLRTPLSATRWALKSSIDGTFQGKEQKELLQKIYDTNNNLINIVGDLLDTSSIENKTFAYDFQEQDISLLLKEVVSSSIFQLKDKKINVNYHEPEDHHITLKLDKDKLSMAFQNIVSNAVDYTPDGGNIDVTLKKENNQIIIEIQDTGIGIPTEAQAHVFEKFYRGDNAKKTETDRSGLGLYISKQIIEKHGGTISVESKEGEGTTVVVRLGLLATARS